MESTSFRCGGKLLPVVFFNLLLSRAGEIEVVLQCKNDVCVGALSINFTKLYFVCVLHCTVGVTRLLLASRLSLLVINKRHCTVISARKREREKRDSLSLIGQYRKYHA